MGKVKLFLLFVVLVSTLHGGCAVTIQILPRTAYENRTPVIITCTLDQSDGWAQNKLSFVKLTKDGRPIAQIAKGGSPLTFGDVSRFRISGDVDPVDGRRSYIRMTFVRQLQSDSGHYACQWNHFVGSKLAVEEAGDTLTVIHTVDSGTSAKDAGKLQTQAIRLENQVIDNESNVENNQDDITDLEKKVSRLESKYNRIQSRIAFNLGDVVFAFEFVDLGKVIYQEGHYLPFDKTLVNYGGVVKSDGGRTFKIPKSGLYCLNLVISTDPRGDTLVDLMAGNIALVRASASEARTSDQTLVTTVTWLNVGEELTVKVMRNGRGTSFVPGLDSPVNILSGYIIKPS